MTKHVRIVLLFSLMLLSVTGSSIAYADETYVIDTVLESPSTPFTKYTWLTTEHPKIASFTTLDNGNAYGMTTTGVPFSQSTVPNNVGIRVQRFEIEDHFHYIVEGKIIGSLEALSTQLALVYASMNK